MSPTSGLDPAAHASRARGRAFLFAFLSLVVASITAYVAWTVVSGYEQQLVGAERVDGEVQVVVAAHDLRSGAILGQEDVVLGPRPANLALESAFLSIDSVLGQTVGEKVLAGEPIRLERLTVGGSALRVNEVIDPGSRAVTIRSSHAASVGGLLHPGFFVDVIVTIRPDTKTLEAEWVTETILQGVRVIAVGDSVSSNPGLVDDRDENDRGAPRDVYVTLEVEPAEAEEIALASSRGQIHLALRARDDFQMLDPGEPLVTNALVGLPKPVAEAQERRLARKRVVAERIAPVAPTTSTTEVIRGGRVTVEEFDEEGRHLGKGR